MPRAKKTLTGEGAIPPQAMKGGPYGSGERALESQRRTPMPNRAGGPPAAAPTAGGGEAPAGGGYQTALAKAKAMIAPESALGAPTARPDEPIDAGLTRMTPTPQPNEGLMELRALVKQYPYPDLVNLLARVEQEM